MFGFLTTHFFNVQLSISGITEHRVKMKINEIIHPFAAKILSMQKSVREIFFGSQMAAEKLPGSLKKSTSLLLWIKPSPYTVEYRLNTLIPVSVVNTRFALEVLGTLVLTFASTCESKYK